MQTVSPASTPVLCKASRIAPAAQEWLYAKSLSRPYHIFEHVCNLINTNGDVLTLILAPAQMNPLALEMDCQAQNLDLRQHILPSDPVQVASDHLAVGGLQIDLRSHEPWDPTFDWSRLIEAREQIESMVNVVLAQLTSDPSRESLAICLTETGTLQELEGVSWQARALDPVIRLLDVLAEGSYEALGEIAGELAGLGPGLTPGADDFIIGLMHAVWGTHSPALATQICHEILRSVKERTNQLSACSMHRAASGEVSATWQAVLDAMALTDQEKLAAQVEALMQLGHTSGQDALTGYLLGFSSLTIH